MRGTYVVSVHTVVQFASGTIWIHAADRAETASATDDRILRTLAAFITPAYPEAVAGAADDPAAARAQIAELERIGALIPTADDAVDDRAPGSLVAQYLAPIAATLDRLAGALSAIGPDVGRGIRAESGIGLEARLLGATAGLIATQQAIGARIPDWIRTQLDRLDLPADGLSIHIGAGSAQIEGWVNIDFWPAPLALDVRWGLPFRDGSADRVYLSHVLEHLYYPDEALALLREVHRVLRPGGDARVVVPDIEACIVAYTTNDRRFFEGRAERWPHWKITTRMESFLGFAGVGPFPGMFGEAHKWGYDFETLTHILTEAGFNDIERSAYQRSRDAALRVDAASAWAGAQVDGRSYSLFADARR